jgi:hypothetical protein
MSTERPLSTNGFGATKTIDVSGRVDAIYGINYQYDSTERCRAQNQQ